MGGRARGLLLHHAREFVAPERAVFGMTPAAPENALGEEFVDF